MSKKDEIIKNLEKEVNFLNDRILTLTAFSQESEVVFTKVAPTIPTVKKNTLKYDRYWKFSIELWPPSWGLSSYRFDWRRFNSESREGSYQLGPFGFSWNRDLKRRK